MASRDVSFTIDCSSQGAPLALVEELADGIFRHFGCSVSHVTGLQDALRKASGAPGVEGVRRCDVQFVAKNGTLEVLVSSNGGRLWQTTVHLP